MIKIKVLNSKTPTESQELEITPQTLINSECFIGRSSQCDIVLASREVSRVHGSIRFEEGQYYFADLASLGGSRVNDEVVKANQNYPLKVNDIIRIGEFVLTIQEFTGIEEKTTQKEEVTTTAKVERQIQQETRRIAIPESSPTLPEPALPPSEYMPVALVPPEQMQCWTKGEIDLRCVRVLNETADVKTFRFVADPPVLFTYKPGQFATLNLQIDGKTIKRSYSISSTPSRPHTLEFTVKRVPPPTDVPDAPAGLGSNWLHDNLKVGDRIKVNGPLGKFTCFANPAQKLLFISAGSGITPMMSMSRWFMDTAADCDLVFFHSARTPQDIIFRRELEWIASVQPKFRLAISITRDAPGQVWSGFRGRLTENLLYAIAPDFWQRTVYVCGPNLFMAGVKSMFKRLDFPMENYYEESFGAPKKMKQKAPTSAPAAPAPTPPTPAPEPVTKTTPAPSEPAVTTPAPSSSGSLTVVFAKSGKTVTCDGQDSILDIAEEEGIEIDSSCRSGVCGTCKVLKREGEVKYEGDPEALDESEQEEGQILTCISYPVGRVVIDA
ncbi:MAG: 2Fe-2S iron-sulfur cluster-binding protein [Xenococcaceae cyanobacterium]